MRKGIDGRDRGRGCESGKRTSKKVGCWVVAAGACGVALQSYVGRLRGRVECCTLYVACVCMFVPWIKHYRIRTRRYPIGINVLAVSSPSLNTRSELIFIVIDTSKTSLHSCFPLTTVQGDFGRTCRSQPKAFFVVQAYTPQRLSSNETPAPPSERRSWHSAWWPCSCTPRYSLSSSLGSRCTSHMHYSSLVSWYQGRLEVAKDLFLYSTSN